MKYLAFAEPDMPGVAKILKFAFGGDELDCEKWLRQSGVEHVRCVRRGHETQPSGCLLRIPMGQYFGKKSVSMLGIAGVGVMPEARGSGMARWMMQQALLEAHREGYALSGLYASTQALYRQVGYEQAGHQFRTHIPIHKINVRSSEPEVRAIEEHDEPQVRACYKAFHSQFNGPLDRGEYVWRRTRDWRDKKYSGFGVFDSGGKLEGYVFFAQERHAATGKHDIVLSDVAFTTPRAGRRLLGFLAGFTTMGEELVIQAGPVHPLASMLGLQAYRVERREYWMTRIVDLKMALEQRGYLQHVRGAMQIDVLDPIIESNRGSWTLSVEHGRGTAMKEDQVRPAIRSTIQGLVPLYTGMYTASQLRTMGWIEGDDAAIDLAEMIFGGFGTPWMSDFF